jgi:hypothetical protein
VEGHERHHETPGRRGTDSSPGTFHSTAVVARWMQKNSESREQVREEEDDGKAKSQTCARRAVLKGASATPHLQHRAHHVRETFAHERVHPGETTAHSHNASFPAECGPTTSADGHDGTVTSVMSAETPAPITAPTFTTTVVTPSTKHPQPTMATNTS